MTRLGNDEAFAGMELIGGNVASTGGVDAVVGRTDDAPPGGGDDLNERAGWDGAAGENAAPFDFSGRVVIAEDAGERVS